jgi:hypothetical protein
VIALSPGNAAVGSVGGKRTAVVTSGFNFPDALAIGPVAYAAKLPVLLTNPSVLSPEASDGLTQLGIQQVVITGGPAAISPAVETAIQAKGMTTVRLQGGDRSATSVAIADWALANVPGFKDAHVNLARGDDFADALAGGPHGGTEDAAPMLVTMSPSELGSTDDYAAAHAANLADGHALGGPAALTDAALDAFATAAGSSGNNQSIDVGPQAQATQAPGTSRNCTVTTPAGATDLDLQLFDSDNVDTTGGTVTFAQAAGHATPGAVGATITTVNGVPVGATFDYDVTPGTLNVTITSGTAGDVTLVAWSDTGSDDNALSVDADGSPFESFGVGCFTTFQPPQAANGPFGATTVDSVNKTAHYWVGGGDSYNYDANDTFTVDSGGGPTPATFATFEAALSPGDSVSGTYAQDTAASSTFNLSDDQPGPPQAVTATLNNPPGNSVTVDWNAPAAPPPNGVDTYNVYRASTVPASPCPLDPASGSSYVKIGDVDGTVLTFDDTTLAFNTKYCYLVRSVSAGQESTDSNIDGATTTAGAATAPTITDAQLTLDAGLLGIGDTGDKHQFTFSQTMDTGIDAAGSSYRVTDGDGTAADIICGTNATCALDGTAKILTITLTATPTPVTAGGTAGLQYPLTLTNISAEWMGTNGVTVDLAGSADKVVDDEP